MKRTETILDGLKVKIEAVKAGKSLRQINDEANFGTNYIYSILDKNNILLSTVDAIANALGVPSDAILTEVEREDDDEGNPANTKAEALAAVGAN